MTDDLDTAGMPTSSDPVEGGVCIVNAALPPGHPDQEVWRSPSNRELAERARMRQATADQAASSARAFLRLARDQALLTSDWVELPSAADRLDPATIQAACDYRQRLRDLDIAGAVAANPSAATVDLLPPAPPLLVSEPEGSTDGAAAAATVDSAIVGQLTTPEAAAP